MNRDAARAVRPAIQAGRFYPGTSSVLKKQVERMLEGAAEPLGGDLRGLIVPHAGYVYSGAVAAAGFRHLRGREYDTVVVLGPSHHYRFDGAALQAKGAFATPLGTVPVDESVCQELMDYDPLIRDAPSIHEPEHDIEVQLPFLQTILPSFRLVPILISDFSDDNCNRLADALAATLEGKNALLVTTTDLSHYPKYEDAVASDKAMVQAIESFDAEEIRERSEYYLSRGIANLHCTMCGTGAVVTGMEVYRRLGATTVRTVRYANSGDVPSGGKNQVVGYVASAFVDETSNGATAPTPQRKRVTVQRPSDSSSEPSESAENSGMLSEPTQRALLVVARETIERAVNRRPYRQVHEYGFADDVLAETRLKRGAFVTIHKNGALRGCIGHVVGDLPLSEVIPQMAVAAATQDPRFPRVLPSEVAELELEMSVLTPPRPVKDPEAVEVGRHGLIVRRGINSGLLLPQVATQQGWNREQFLAYTCIKAGLRPDAFRMAGTVIESFEAQVFSEADFKEPS
jgi:hypothetical protein